MDLQFNTSGDVVGHVGMTMAAIAYAPGQSAITALLADTTLATAGRWTLVWYGVDDASQVYVARDTVTGQQAVAIRGSVTDSFEEAFWLDWFQEDLSVFRMADWPYGGAPPGAKVSHGSLSGLGSLLRVQDASKQTLVAFLRANRTNALTAVLGHSLGGALSYLLAPYLHQEFSPEQDVLDFWPVTFAAPTVGNGTYAAWLQSQFAASVSRYYNSVDVVPHSWQDLAWIAASFPGGPKMPLAQGRLIDGIRDILKLLKDSYVQPGTGVQLDGTIVVTDDWVQEAGTQHVSATYLSLVGAPPLTSLGSGKAPTTDRGAPPTAR